jgi:signal transduction histidine kinase
VTSRKSAIKRRAQGIALTPPADVSLAANAASVIPLELVAERVLLSALREQDAAAAADVARQRAEFLADASLRFGASLDQELTYAAIAGVALPGLDAWCILDIIEVGNGLRRLAVVHPDEDKRGVAHGLAERWTPDADDPIGVPAVRLNRVPVVITERADAVVSAAARDPDTLRILQWLGAGSLLVVPIISNDALLGAITYVSRPGAPAYTSDDIRLAEALASRCAQALEAARLYAAARAAWADAEAARAESEAANATKVHFLRSMSHELRTPLNAIGGYAQLLEMGLRGPITLEQQSDLASIQRSQLHLLGLVDSVLNYAQIGAGRTTYATTDIQIVEVLEGIESFVAPQMRLKELDYAFSPGETPLIARADTEKLRQIVLNLLGNAAKFTPVGGRITVSCEAVAFVTGTLEADSTNMIMIRVADTGVGIPADQLESVFDPFVQVNRGLTSPDVGVGLGLAISRELARGMGGDLTAQSAVGAGSTFTLRLPSATRSATEA